MNQTRQTAKAIAAARERGDWATVEELTAAWHELNRQRQTVLEADRQTARAAAAELGRIPLEDRIGRERPAYRPGQTAAADRPGQTIGHRPGHGPA